jgi:hypothetical protein
MLWDTVVIDMLWGEVHGAERPHSFAHAHRSPPELNKNLEFNFEV